MSKKRPSFVQSAIFSYEAFHSGLCIGYSMSADGNEMLGGRTRDEDRETGGVVRRNENGGR